MKRRNKDSEDDLLVSVVGIFIFCFIVAITIVCSIFRKASEIVFPKFNENRVPAVLTGSNSVKYMNIRAVTGLMK